MALSLALAFTGATAGALLAPQPAQAQNVRVSFDLFYRDLAPHGRWIDHPRYGWAWYPTRVHSEWRPYSDGEWVWTDRHGWYWQSQEPFGWATYHYGRWDFDDYYGWIWVPGYEWAPAWVSFRHGHSAIGWAPLPPQTLGLSLAFLRSGIYIELSRSYYRPRWVFVPNRHFTAYRVHRYAYPWRNNVTYINQTTIVNNYVTINNVIVNRSIDPRRVERYTGRRVETVRVNNVRDHRDLRTRSDPRSVNVFSPRIERDERAAPPPEARARSGDRPAVRVQREAMAPNESSSRERFGQDRASPDRASPDRAGPDRDGRFERGDERAGHGRDSQDREGRFERGPDRGDPRGDPRFDRGNERGNDRAGPPARALPADPSGPGGSPSGGSPPTMRSERAAPDPREMRAPPSRNDRAAPDRAAPGREPDPRFSRGAPDPREMRAPPSVRSERPAPTRQSDPRFSRGAPDPSEMRAPPSRNERAAPQRAEPRRIEPQRAEPRRAEPQRAAPQRVEPQRAAPQRSAPSRTAEPRDRGRSSSDDCGGRGQRPCG